MTHSNTSASSLLVDNLSLITSLQFKHGVLDLACGNGRNGLFLIKHKVPVIFADSNASCLQAIATQRTRKAETGEVSAGDGKDELGSCWEVDFEIPNSEPLAGKKYDAVVVFNYLHRPLIPALREAIRPGGLVIYETFTAQQAEYGRPRNPDFLLMKRELEEMFAGWKVLHSFEGLVEQPLCAKASLIARKPE